MLDLDRILTGQKEHQKERVAIHSTNIHPIGPLSTFTIQVKFIILQQIWEHGLEWDKEIPEDLWQRWCDELPAMSTLNIARRYDVAMETK